MCLEQPSQNELDRCIGFIESSRWTFAKTMANIPHEYTKRDGTKSIAEFEWFITMINKFGERKRFYSKTFKYLTIGKHKYWAMGVNPKERLLINRALVSNDRQSFSMTERQSR